MLLNSSNDEVKINLQFINQLINIYTYVDS